MQSWTSRCSLGRAGARGAVAARSFSYLASRGAVVTARDPAGPRLGARHVASSSADYDTGTESWTEDQTRSGLITTISYQQSLKNSVFLIGRIGAEMQKYKEFPTGKCVGELSLAINSSKDDGPGQWVDLVLWDDLCRAAREEVHKGASVAVRGRLTINSWTPPEGGYNRKTYRIVVDAISFVESAGEMGAANGEAYDAAPAGAGATTSYGDGWQGSGGAARQADPSPPPAGAPAADPGPPPPPRAGGWQGGAGGAAAAGGGADRLWAEYFENPAAWWDNRNDKQGNPKRPDFKHKDDRSKALWLSSRDTPAWVHERLGQAGGAGGAGGADDSPPWA
ncbi:unnamed protein product [Pedinophyceae sp. YPF-701]|nr:unnamed protein product [Pedinophyceae sp. YPF-701]